MANEKTPKPLRLLSEMSSDPETDAHPVSPDSMQSNITEGHADRRNHPLGAIPRTGTTSQQEETFTSQHDSGFHASREFSSGVGSSRTKICPSGHESIRSDENFSRAFESSGQNSDDELIKAYLEELPDESLKVGFFDVMIIYCEVDREKAQAYRDHLNQDIKTKSGKHIKAVLFDDPELESLAGSKFAHLEKAFERCTFAFVYLTKEFCENDDGWCRVSSEECLMKAIYDKDKKWCVVPVYTVQRNKANFKIPMGLNALKGINYYNNDEFYRRGLTKLLEDKLFVRENSEKIHREKILDEIRKYILQQKEQQKNFRLMRMNSEIEARKQEERHQKQLRAVSQQNRGLHQYAFTPPTDNVQMEKSSAIYSKQIESLQGQGQYDESVESLRDKLDIKPDAHCQTPSSDGNLPNTVDHSMRSYWSSPPKNLQDEIQSRRYNSKMPGEHSVEYIEPNEEGADESVSHVRQKSLEPDSPDSQPNQNRSSHICPPSGYQNRTDFPPYHTDKAVPSNKVIVQEIHHHHHYPQHQPEEGDKKKVINIIGAKNVQIGEHGNIVSTQGGEIVEEKNCSDADSGSEQQTPDKKGVVDESQSIVSADGYPSNQDVDSGDTQTTHVKESSKQLNKNQSMEPNQNSKNDENQTIVKKVDESSVKKNTDGVSADDRLPDKSLETRSEGLSLGSLVSDKSHHFKQRDPKMKPFAEKKSARRTATVQPIMKSEPQPSKKSDDMGNVINNVMAGSNDREMESADFENSLKACKDKTFSGEKELSDQTDEKVTYRNCEETDVKQVHSSVPSHSDETEVKQDYHRTVEGRNLPSHMTVATGNKINSNIQTSNVNKVFNHKSNIPNIVPNNSYSVLQGQRNTSQQGPASSHVGPVLQGQRNTSQQGPASSHVGPVLQGQRNTSQKGPTNSHVDPDETEVLKPVPSRFSRDLDTDGGELESIPSSINSSNEFTIISPYSDTLTDEDKEVNAVTTVLEMGFSDKDVKKCLNGLQRANPGRRHFSVPDFLEILIDRDRLSSTSFTDIDSGSVEDEISNSRSYEKQQEQTLIHKSATDTVLSKKPEKSSVDRQASEPTSHSGSTKEKCCIT